jgi:alanine racemase
VEINLTAYKDNLKYLKSLMSPKQSFLMIVKADAYGHGAAEISRIAGEMGAVYLGVANPEEGKLLRVQSCTAPILVLSPSLESEIDTIIGNGLTPSVSTREFALALDTAAGLANTIIPIHIKVDTGMHRSGADADSFLGLYESISKLKNLVIEGVFSHFAASETDKDFCKKQEHQFAELLGKLPTQPKYVHIDNSNALVEGYGANSNLVRLGILAYGVNTSSHPLPLKPVMTFKTTLSQIKTIAKGESVGYNRSWTAKKDGTYGILPVGYADGYDYLLGNRGNVLLNSKPCKVIGRISMDMITIDLSAAPEAKIGDVVILLGDDMPELKAEHVAAHYGGNPYELLCQVGRRAKRFYYADGKLIHSTPLSRREFVPDDFNDSKLNTIIESAISQRLQSDEIGELIYKEILRTFFYNKDKDIHYRHNFHHEISFSDSLNAGYYKATTILSFEKVLQNDYFIVACASSDEVLRRYFKRSDVEYRWLMDDAFILDDTSFNVSSVMIDDIVLGTDISFNNRCLEIKCSHPKLSKLVGKKVRFQINTQTLYPKASHQLSVFVTELTRGVYIAFNYPDELPAVECVPVFSGQDKYPGISTRQGTIVVKSRPDEWVFPISGVVFAY